MNPKPKTARRSPPERNWRAAAFPVVLMLPALTLFLLVIAYPLVQSLAYSLFDASLLSGESTFVGLANIEALLGSPGFWDMLTNTAVFVVASTLGAFVLALALALAMNAGIVGAGAWRTGFLLPWILPGVVVSFLWSWISTTNWGLRTGVTQPRGGAGHPNGLSPSALAMTAVIVAKVWHSFPWMMVLLLAAMQAIPAELHDAASVDGAGGWKRQAYIVIPQIKPAMALTLLLETIWGLQHFEIPWVMTGGGPVGSTTLLSIGLYKQAFQRFDLGGAGAIGLLWAVIMAAVATAYILYSRHQERSNA